MRLLIAAVGHARAGPERVLAEDYVDRARRLAPRLGFRGLDLVEIEESRRRDAEERRSEEAAALLAATPEGAVLLALDERGENLPSAAFARRLAALRDAGRPGTAFLIGGPDGHGSELRRRAELTLAFGAATWPHLLVRVLLAEQIYRALTILAGHPYHRA
ncbi:MAG: 23S rRNA (pseudouridine(1915)-N(3))-methyltransferase RlmH [Pseudomonadota bacterium]|nr:23S rRNA (pseudouridine(1915)-N(3))-methyltransferase RlmH [Pseudomonadota bacterium]